MTNYIDTFRKIALSFEGATEESHFEKNSFRLKKRIFATYDAKLSRACLKLSPEDQNVFQLFDNKHIYPVPNKWGLKGWTFFELPHVDSELLRDAMDVAFKGLGKGR